MENIQRLFFALLQNFDISYKRYFFDKVDFSEKLIGILGDRGIGKTTFLLQYLKEIMHCRCYKVKHKER